MSLIKMYSASKKGGWGGRTPPLATGLYIYYHASLDIFSYVSAEYGQSGHAPVGEKQARNEFPLELSW